MFHCNQMNACVWFYWSLRECSMLLKTHIFRVVCSASTEFIEICRLTAMLCTLQHSLVYSCLVNACRGKVIVYVSLYFKTNCVTVRRKNKRSITIGLYNGVKSINYLDTLDFATSVKKANVEWITSTQRLKTTSLLKFIFIFCVMFWRKVLWKGHKYATPAVPVSI